MLFWPPELLFTPKLEAEQSNFSLYRSNSLYALIESFMPRSSSHKDVHAQTFSVILNGAGCTPAAGCLPLELPQPALKSKEVISDLSP